MGKIETLIEEIKDYVAGCKPAAFSSNKVMVDKIQLEEFLDELSSNIPIEVRQCQRLLANKESILAEAKEDADRIVKDAKEKTKQLVNDHDIIQQATAIGNKYVYEAQSEAERIREEAEAEATAVREGAIAYTDELLQNIENALLHTLDTTQTRFNGFTNSLTNTLNVVRANRAELSSAPETEPVSDTAEEAMSAMGDEYDF